MKVYVLFCACKYGAPEKIDIFQLLSPIIPGEGYRYRKLGCHFRIWQLIFMYVRLIRQGDLSGFDQVRYLVLYQAVFNGGLKSGSTSDPIPRKLAYVSNSGFPRCHLFVRRTGIGDWSFLVNGCEYLQLAKEEISMLLYFIIWFRARLSYFISQSKLVFYFFSLYPRISTSTIYSKQRIFSLRSRLHKVRRAIGQAPFSISC